MNIIFIVEDNRADLRLITETLKNMEKKIETKFFYDGESAIAFLSHITKVENAPLGIILDINMQKVNGFEVLDFIRKNETLAEIPVVMLSSSDTESDMKKAEALNAGYFIKPLNFDDLENVMSSILCVFHIN
jgi:CheY-like chemotaxis protein